jgi:hypothetical protein
MKFRAVLELNGKTATGIEVPPEILDHLGGGKRPAVTVTLGSYTYRTTVGAMGGRFLLPVSAEIRAASGVTAGDEIDVDIELDTAPRELAVPDDFSAALAGEPDARRFFEGLSYSNRRRFVLSIEDAKTPETRQRRIDKAIASLREGKV